MQKTIFAATRRVSGALKHHKCVAVGRDSATNRAPQIH